MSKLGKLQEKIWEIELRLEHRQYEFVNGVCTGIERYKLEEVINVILDHLNLKLDRSPSIVTLKKKSGK